MATFSTSTVTDTKELVPWLAATGPLSYSPENPPPRDYFFQYGWVIPDVLNAEYRRRMHFYFGRPYKEDSGELFRFWNSARQGGVRREACRYGQFGKNSCTAPIAIYRYRQTYRNKDDLFFIQHGSYQIVSEDEQPYARNGYVLLYRGIGEARTFRYLRYDIETCAPKARDLVEKYFRLQAHVLSDSVKSFKVAHDSLVRSETTFLNDRSRIWNEMALKSGIEHESCEDSFKLKNSYRQCFSLYRHGTLVKFGPNHVVAKTPIDNIHLTTFFAGEFEVKVIDPNKVEFRESIGCEIEYESLSQ